MNLAIFLGILSLVAFVVYMTIVFVVSVMRSKRMREKEESLGSEDIPPSCYSDGMAYDKNGKITSIKTKNSAYYKFLSDNSK